MIGLHAAILILGVASCVGRSLHYNAKDPAEPEFTRIGLITRDEPQLAPGEEVSTADTNAVPTNGTDKGAPDTGNDLKDKDTGNDPKDKGNDPKDKGNDPKDKGNNPKDNGNNTKDKGNDPKDTGNDPKDKGNDPKDTGNDPKDRMPAVSLVCKKLQIRAKDGERLSGSEQNKLKKTCANAFICRRLRGQAKSRKALTPSEVWYGLNLCDDFQCKYMHIMIEFFFF
jgi:hypothetical protein